MVETPILSTGYQSIDELRAVNRELVTQCARRNREFEQEMEKCFEENNKLQDKINQLNATIQILEAEIESLKNVRSASVRNFREPVYSTTYYGEKALKFGDCDENGNYLELKNDSFNPLELKGVKIRRIAGDSLIEISLPDKTKMAMKSSLRIYGKKSIRSLTHGIKNIVANEIDTWPTGKLMQTFLLDERGVEIASVIQTMDE